MAELITRAEVDPDELPDEGGALDDLVQKPSTPARSGAEIMMAGRRATRAQAVGGEAVQGTSIGVGLAV